jgi:hypothetical protein
VDPGNNCRDDCRMSETIDDREDMTLLGAAAHQPQL